MSVSELSVWPRAASPSRSSWKFSMMPLWMTVMSPVQSTWGCAFRSFGRPWVAQRVWARPIAACGRPVGERRLEVAELAGPLLDEQVAVVVDERDAGRVVAAVLEAREALDQDGPGLTRSDVADDPAHAVRVSWRPGPRLRAGLV